MRFLGEGAREGHRPLRGQRVCRAGWRCNGVPSFVNGRGRTRRPLFLDELGIECLYRLLAVVVGHRDDNADLARTLVEEYDIHVCYGIRTRELGEYSRRLRHAAADSADERGVPLHHQLIGLTDLSDAVEHGLEFAIEFAVIDCEADAVYAAWHVVEPNLLISQDAKQFPCESHFIVHTCIFKRDDREALAGGNTGDGTETRGRQLLLCVDVGASALRGISIAYVDGDTRIASREHRIIVENPRTGIGELAHFLVAHPADHFRISYNGGIGPEDPVDLSPVLVDSGSEGSCDASARD